jgi:hypothetical protein
MADCIDKPSVVCKAAMPAVGLITASAMEPTRPARVMAELLACASM